MFAVALNARLARVRLDEFMYLLDTSTDDDNNSTSDHTDSATKHVSGERNGRSSSNTADVVNHEHNSSRRARGFPKRVSMVI